MFIFYILYFTFYNYYLRCCQSNYFQSSPHMFSTVLLLYWYRIDTREN